MKMCQECKEDKILAVFYHSPRGWVDSYCYPCRNIRSRRNYNRERQYMYGIKFRYGLTKVQYLDLIADQEYKCMICECELADPCVDHDHQTGRVRGIICRSCNTIIGIAKDSPELLRRAAVYVEKREP